MLRVLQKLRKPTNTGPLFTSPSQPTSIPSPRTVRLYGTADLDVDPVALQMINYALNLARSQKSPDAYSQAHLVLKQCFSANMPGGINSAETTKGVVLLAMSTLLSERGEYSEAMENLEKVQELGSSSLGVRVAAMEGLVGLNLELGQDDSSATLADKGLQLFKDNRNSDGETEVLKSRTKAVKGLVELVLGNTETAATCFGELCEDQGHAGNVALSHGEFLHATGKFELAKEMYHKAMPQWIPQNVDFTNSHALASCNMVPVEVFLGSTCAFGQLEAHSGNFNDAEDSLTRALTKAEEYFGLRHPKVGVILTCIALMFRRKARLEHSSSIVIQEGLYRKALELLKAPSLDIEEAKVERGDIVALARGGYADILCVQQNRKEEGERMRNWAEAVWRNHRLSLAEALEISEHPSQVAVVDTRMSRVL